MILILASSGDINPDFVIEWLDHHGHPYLRINSDEMLSGGFEFSLHPPRIALDGKELDLDAIGCIWFWKFGNFHRSAYYKRAKGRMHPLALEQIVEESNKVLNALLLCLKGKHWLTHPGAVNVSKLAALQIASRHGLKVPETRIVNRKDRLLELLEEGEWITKSIYEPLFLEEHGGVYSMLTKQLDRGTVERLGETFFPSLVQRKIDKAYELRVFYLDGECHAMAILSQGDSRTALDFRNYDRRNPNRWLPYVLPAEEQARIRGFMEEVGLNCGSLDLIRGTDGGYTFLEVNPTGQFGMVGLPCNFPLYERIAEYLIAHDRQPAHVS